MGHTSSHEAAPPAEARGRDPGQWPLGPPILAEAAGTRWPAITEANLTNYAGMYLARDAGGGAVLESRLSPRPGEPKVAVRAHLPLESPWRAFTHRGKPGTTGRVRPRAQPQRTLCIRMISPGSRPGKTTFPWWNGFHEEKVPFEMGLNTETAMHYIDFCAEVGIPDHSLDGKGSTAWYMNWPDRAVSGSRHHQRHRGARPSKGPPLRRIQGRPNPPLDELAGGRWLHGACLPALPKVGR